MVSPMSVEPQLESFLEVWNTDFTGYLDPSQLTISFIPNDQEGKVAVRIVVDILGVSIPVTRILEVGAA